MHTECLAACPATVRHSLVCDLVSVSTNSTQARATVLPYYHLKPNNGGLLIWS